jgi:tRNA A-37 threonylcarbamoyl transferase component Bud32
MTPSVFRPLLASRAHWRAPAATHASEWIRVRERLELIVSESHTREVYSALRRSIFRVDDEVLGPLAIKEMRNESLGRQLLFRTLRAGRVVQEFSSACEFEARGGRTPHVFGAALEVGTLRLHRVLLFIAWLGDAVTLTTYLARLADPPPAGVLESIASQLAATARLGLIHGRHSSDNLLVAARGASPEIYTIDFAYSKLVEGVDESAYANDVGRIVHWLWHERIVCDPTLDRLIDCCAAAVDREGADPRARAIREALLRWKSFNPHRVPEAKGRLPAGSSSEKEE